LFVYQEEKHMTYKGRIKNGVVVFDEPHSIPDGTPVEVIPIEEEGEEKDLPPTVYERLESVIGMADNLPPDASLNHDHYLYGTPKK
jgi:hypothetical protein